MRACPHRFLPMTRRSFLARFQCTGSLALNRAEQKREGQQDRRHYSNPNMPPISGPYTGLVSFLDNLENNLKALENQQQRDPEQIKRDQERREAERAAALQRAPHVEALKTSAFTTDLLTHCRTIGRGQRVLVQFTWIGETLRLDAKSQRMELTPTADGIVAICSVDGAETGRFPVDPHTADPAELAR